MLTARQRVLLRAIIQEFIDTAQAVGSLNLAEKYGIDVSPATIRNEMAELSELGLLGKDHASAGRKPTSRALRMFLEEMMGEFEDLDSVSTAEASERIFQTRFNVDKLLNEAVLALNHITLNTTVALLNGKRFIAGLSNFIDMPEFRDPIHLRKILNIMDDYNILADLFNKYAPTGDVRVLIDDEAGIDLFTDTAVAFAQIRLHGGEAGYIAVVGPNRMNYARVIPAIKYVVRGVQDAIAGW